MIKVFVVGGPANYVEWIKDSIPVNTTEEADLVVFTGGEDVSPVLYGEPAGKWTDYNTHRDAVEIKEYNRAKQLGKPTLGICRGSQFLCVMNGGKLVQHQSNPAFVHSITTDEGEFMITSTHHQAQYPYDMGEDQYRLLGWTEGLSNIHLDGNNKEISDTPFKEAEIVYYPVGNDLGIQGHPEYGEMARYPDTINYLNGLVTKLLNNTL